MPGLGAIYKMVHFNFFLRRFFFLPSRCPLQSSFSSFLRVLMSRIKSKNTCDKTNAHAVITHTNTSTKIPFDCRSLALSMLFLFKAEVSTYWTPQSRALDSASTTDTCRFFVKSPLLPTSMNGTLSPLFLYLSFTQSIRSLENNKSSNGHSYLLQTLIREPNIQESFLREVNGVDNHESRFYGTVNRHHFLELFYSNKSISANTQWFDSD